MKAITKTAGFILLVLGMTACNVSGKALPSVKSIGNSGGSVHLSGNVSANPSGNVSANPSDNVNVSVKVNIREEEKKQRNPEDGKIAIRRDVADGKGLVSSAAADEKSREKDPAPLAASGEKSTEKDLVPLAASDEKVAKKVKNVSDKAWPSVKSTGNSDGSVPSSGNVNVSVRVNIYEDGRKRRREPKDGKIAIRRNVAAGKGLVSSAAVGEKSTKKDPAPSVAVDEKSAEIAPAPSAAVGEQSTKKDPAPSAAVGEQSAEKDPAPSAAVGEQSTKKDPAPSAAAGEKSAESNKEAKDEGTEEEVSLPATQNAPLIAAEQQPSAYSKAKTLGKSFLEKDSGPQLNILFYLGHKDDGSCWSDLSYSINKAGFFSRIDNFSWQSGVAFYSQEPKLYRFRKYHSLYLHQPGARLWEDKPIYVLKKDQFFENESDTYLSATISAEYRRNLYDHYEPGRGRVRWAGDPQFSWPHKPKETPDNPLLGLHRLLTDNPYNFVRARSKTIVVFLDFDNYYYHPEEWENFVQRHAETWFVSLSSRRGMAVNHALSSHKNLSWISCREDSKAASRLADFINKKAEELPSEDGS